MGGGGASYLEAEELYRKARDLGLRRPNIRYTWSAKRDTHIETDVITYQLVGPPYFANLFCGSDAPYGRVAWNFGGFRAMFDGLLRSDRHTDERVRSRPGLFSPEAVQSYLGGNFARFMLTTCKSLLLVQGATEGPDAAGLRQAELAV